MRVCRPPPHRVTSASSIECPCQESNLVYDFRKVECLRYTSRTSIQSPLRREVVARSRVPPATILPPPYCLDSGPSGRGLKNLWAGLTCEESWELRFPIIVVFPDFDGRGSRRMDFDPNDDLSHAGLQADTEGGWPPPGTSSRRFAVDQSSQSKSSCGQILLRRP